MTRAVIVFGASGGLGGGLLAELAAAGDYEVYGTAYRASAKLAATLAELDLDASRHAFEVDATKFDEVRACVATVAARSELWGIVNLVGVSTAKRLASEAPADVEHTLRSNILPAFWTTKALFESHRELGCMGGRIVHASSVLARRPVPGTIPYVAAKCAVEGLARASAEEAARYGLTVNALRLGYFDAGMSAGVPERMLEDVRASSALKRLGSVPDLVAAAGFLLGDSAAFVTGATIDVDGGLV